MGPDPQAMAEILRMASIYKERQYFDLAIRMLTEAISTARADYDSVAVLFYNLAEVYSDEGNYFASRIFYKKAATFWQRGHTGASDQLLSQGEILGRLQMVSDALRQHTSVGRRQAG